jgi:hypothetical protein
VSTWGRSNPDDDREEEPLRLERVGGRAVSWRLVVTGIGVVLIVGALWVKPWDMFAPTVPAPPPQVPVVADIATEAPQATEPDATASPTAIPDPTSDPLVVAARRRQCQSPVDWRMVTAERTVTRDTRTMYAVSPVAADGPADPTLPLSHVYAGTLEAVGVCVPRSPVVSPVNTLHDVVLWQVEKDGTAREIQRPVLLDPYLYDIGEAYFGPPAGEGPNWPAARYVFEIRRAAGPGSMWMALEFVPTRG